MFTKLFYRHWDEWVEDKRQHLFVMTADGGEPKDVTPGDRDAFPTSETFSTGDNFTFSPDGKYLVFTAVPEKNEAWSTNYEICRVPVDGRHDEVGIADEGQPGGEQRAAVFAGRQEAGLPGAAARRLRSGQVGVDGCRYAMRAAPSRASRPASRASSTDRSADFIW